MQIKRVKIVIKGIVQGVGMRPTIYRYADQFDLSGFVQNDSEGVVIEVQGSETDVTNFCELLINNPPPLAKIDSFEHFEIKKLEESSSFEIISSDSDGEKDVEISPDIATCEDCLKEIRDPDDRRFSYPFTNCTNCGPRFTIIHDRPYDRPLTSMNEFKMCPDCQKEYDDPKNRRFHAQPNACPVCGPKLSMVMDNTSGNPLVKTITLIEEGKIVAIKGLGGFNIACDPTNIGAINRLREVKNRPNKAFALMMRDIETVKRFCYLNEAQEKILNSSIAPIVLLQKKDQSFEHISPDNNYLGVMLPYTPLHHLLMGVFNFLVMTSANKRDEPIAIDDSEIKDLIEDGVIDDGLTHNREIVHRCDDSIVHFVQDKMQIIRRSRGFVPYPIRVNNSKSSNNLSYGANMKNTFSLKKGDRVYMSQHIGELVDSRNYDYQNDQIEDYKKLLTLDNLDLHCDVHPGYENFDENAKHVYHHHAHAISVMGEHNLLGEEVLGVICDGTGLGTDDNIWGFEFLKVGEDFSKFERLAHLDYFPLPGSDKAIHEIDRIGVALTQHIDDLDKIPFENDRIALIRQVIEDGLNCPMVSSLGRLFDGVCSLLGFIDKAEYDARAAIVLQKVAEECLETSFSSDYSVGFKDGVIEYKSMILELLDDLKNEEDESYIAYKFHRWVVDSIINVLDVLKIKKVVFSGGCFQNLLLYDLLEKSLAGGEFEYYFNRDVPINDAGISFGQTLI